MPMKRLPFRKLANLYVQADGISDRTASLETLRKDAYLCCLRAAFSKLLEFNIYTHSSRKHDHIFFDLATLRGCCEDLIFLSYLKTFHPRTRSRMISIITREKLERSIKAQTVYFTRNRSKQWIIKHSIKESTETIGQARIELNKTIKRYKKISTFPSIKQMSLETGFSELYDSLYHATSNLVHFNPNVLLRTGWGDSESFQFSIKNFQNYYRHFCCVYGGILFIHYVHKFTNLMTKETKLLRSLAKEIEATIEGHPRWAELVTFEEMNIKVDEYPNFLFVAISMVKAEEEIELLD